LEWADELYHGLFDSGLQVCTLDPVAASSAGDTFPLAGDYMYWYFAEETNRRSGTAQRKRHISLPDDTRRRLVSLWSAARSIIRHLKQTQGINVVEDVIHDYANYFFPI
jgi:hypothetical protein